MEINTAAFKKKIRAIYSEATLHHDGPFATQYGCQVNCGRVAKYEYH